MKTVLVYVLSAERAFYPMLEGFSRETWDAEHLDGVPTWYYSGEPEGPKAERKMYFQAGREDYNTIGHKDLMAYRWALDNLGWDYMARVNASCYVHKRRLFDAVQKLPDRQLMRGVITEPSHVSGTDRQFLWGGGQYVISRDVVQSMVDNGDKWKHDVMEDVAMSELCRDIGIPLDGSGPMCSLNPAGDGTWNCTAYPNGSFKLNDEKEIALLCAHYFFRVKHDPDRTQDGRTMRLLKEYL